MGGSILGGGAYEEPHVPSEKQVTIEDIRKQELGEQKDRQLKEQFLDYLIDYALGKVAPSPELKLGQYAIVGFDSGNNFIYVGCKEDCKDAAALRKLSEMNYPSSYMTVLEVRVEDVPKVKITKK